jgi:hypothetical protein
VSALRLVFARQPLYLPPLPVYVNDRLAVRLGDRRQQTYTDAVRYGYNAARQRLSP